MALVDDYDVVLMGVANMLERYRDRVVVAELDADMAVDDVARLSYRRPDAVKSYIRTVYRKIDVASRTQAVL
ncbi:MAG TPA: hypothetical protein VIU87_07010 [Mycobacterium sp.]